MANLPTTDTAAQIGSRTVSELFSGATSIAEAAIITAQPWLGDPFIKPLWEAVFEYITGQIGGAFGTEGGFIVMDVQSFLNLKNAATALAALQSAQASGDPNAIATANQNIDAAVAPILHFVGVSNPSASS